MKRTMFLILSGCILLFGSVVFGCAKKEAAVIKIGTIEVTAKEFERAFGMSRYVSSDPNAKKMFLDIFITRKLMLREAENLGLDKDPSFLQNIQLFWEQSLLKSVLAHQANEIGMHAKVTDVEIKEFYANNKEKHFANTKDVSEVYGHIRWILLNEKNRRLMQRWVEGLRKKTTIFVDEKKLGLQ